MCACTPTIRTPFCGKPGCGRPSPDTPGTLALRILGDLDRCEHGRHEGDICSGATGCNGPSKGNPLFATGAVIGHTLHRTYRIVVPARERRHDPAAWLERI